MDLKIIPLTDDRWDDFEALFGAKGACGGCWCMWWRLKHSEFQTLKGEGNKQAMRAIVESGRVPGLLAYHADLAVGWCSVAPRPEYVRLTNSKILKPVDAQPVWSVVCFYIAPAFRNQGVSAALLRGAIDYVRQCGGKIVEGYPVEPIKIPAPPVFVYTGLAAAFHKAGFSECARRSPTRPIMRYYLT